MDAEQIILSHLNAMAAKGKIMPPGEQDEVKEYIDPVIARERFLAAYNSGVRWAHFEREIGCPWGQVQKLFRDLKKEGAITPRNRKGFRA